MMPGEAWPEMAKSAVVMKVVVMACLLAGGGGVLGFLPRRWNHHRRFARRSL
jgi:hypothetical protein